LAATTELNECSEHAAVESEAADRGLSTEVRKPSTPVRARSQDTPRVSILTCCRNLDLFYGTELIFKTLRVGFPNACVSVVDNCSVPEARSEIESLAKQTGCRFSAVSDSPLSHDRFIQKTIRDAAEDADFEGPLVFVDPDVCLWESWEDVHFDGLVAGKLVGRFFDPVTQTVTMPRLHTSLLWIPDPTKLWEAVLRIKSTRFDFEPFLSCSVHLDGTWYRYDTGASLYAALPDHLSRFEERHLDGYDHIYAGSHLDWVFDSYDEPCQRMFSQVHGAVRAGDLDALRGIWRYQDAVFHRSIRGSQRESSHRRS